MIRILQPRNVQLLTQSLRFRATEAVEHRSVEWNEAKPFDQIPGAKPWPLIGTLWQFLPFVGHPIRDQSRQFEITEQRIGLYGRISKDVIPGWPGGLVWITRPEDAETLYRNEGRFPNRMTTQSMMMHREKRPDIFKHSAGLVLDNGEAWWRIRSKAQQPLLKTKNMRNYLPIVGQIADEFIDRMLPVASGNQRVTDKDLVMSGYQIPKGTILITCVEWMCRQEEYFPKPSEFIPERWIKGHPMESKASPYVLLPFGFGTRMCIGRRLAELEMYQLTCKMLQNFNIEYHHEDIGCLWRLINSPDKPLRFTFIDLK